MKRISHQEHRAHGVGLGALRGLRERSLLILAFVPFLLAAQVPAPEAKKPTEPLKLAPRGYFAAHCQRCHGVDGTNFAPGFAKEPLEKLRADIVRMAEGPGGAPLKPEDVEVQLGYHQLISAEKPFVSWTGREGLVLKGEMTEGAKLVASVGTLKIGADEDAWTLTLPVGTDLPKLKLTATLDKQETVFVPSESAYAKPSEKKPATP